MTTVDVVIPVRDGARFLPACLDSVLAQTFPINRIIVVDDGSTDDTAGVIADYARRHASILAIRSDPKGVSHARNLGIRASTADLVAFVDADDIWRPEKIARQVPLFERSPDVGFAHCAYFHIDEHGAPLDDIVVRLPTRRGDIFVPLLDGYPLSGSASAVVARRELLLQTGGFDETLAHAEDFDAWVKLARLSHVDYSADALTGIRSHAGSVQRRPNRRRMEIDFLSRMKVVEKWMGDYRPSPEILSAYRVEAANIGLLRILFRFQFGFYGLMHDRAPRFVEAVFGGGVAEYRKDVRSIVFPTLAYLVARHVVMRSRLLIRCCHFFGKLKEVPG